MNKLIKIGFYVMILFYAGNLCGQINNPRDLWQNPQTNDFTTIRGNVRNYYSGRSKGHGSGYKQFRRWEYINQNRLTPDGKVTNFAARNWEAYNHYIEQLKNSNKSPLLTTSGQWSSLGIDGYTNGAGWNPGVGRVNVIAFHPTLVNTFWVGTPAGGLWKTTNGGSSWTPLTDGMPQIGVSGIAVDYTNTNVMYILTGDGDAGNTKSIGVLKTIDGGITWLSTGLTWTINDDKRGYKLIMHPTSPNILIAATSNGIYITTNSGATWDNPLYGTTTYDVAFKPGNPSYVYTVTSNEFWISDNAGNNWIRITNGIPTNSWRMAIGVSAASPSKVYLLAGPATGIGSYVGLYVSTDSGLSFSLKSNTPNILGYETDGQDSLQQTTYDLAMAVSPTSAGTLVTGGINCWKSTNSGSSFSIISNWNDYLGNQGIGYTHADIHALAMNPMNGWLYCCSDGGVFRSVDFGENWSDLTTGLSNTQWYKIAGFEADPSLIIGGTQDNGSDIWIGGSTMQHILGGDGGDCMIDPTNSNIMYYEADGGLCKSTDGGNTNVSLVGSNVIGPPIVTPLIMNHNVPTTIYAGYDTIRKSTNGGSTWTTLLTNNPQGTGAMAIGINNPNRLYASAGGSIWRSDNAGSNWTNVSASLSAQPITNIAVNPDNAMEVFVTFGGYTDGQKVYHSTSGGASWTNISGSLPNVSANCIAFEDNNGSPAGAVYVGTDIGVFYRNANMTDWIPFQNGLPTAPISDFLINKTAGIINASTYGRGLWSSQLYTACPDGYNLSPTNDPSNPNYTGVQDYQANSFIESTRTVTGGVGTNVTYTSGNYVQLQTGFHVLAGNQFKATLGPCQAAKKTLVIQVTGTYAGSMQK